MQMVIDIHQTLVSRSLSIGRWITQVERNKGVPQGSVIGPILASLFLHYAFDEWMKRKHSNISFERYADDTICHCVSLKQAEFIKREIQQRFAACKLELNETKTKIVYCKKNHRDIPYDLIQFDFLGYTFKPRRAIDKHGRNIFTIFSGNQPQREKENLGNGKKVEPPLLGTTSIGRNC